MSKSDKPVGYPPTQDVDGLLFSQIGYDPEHPVRIIVRSRTYKYLPTNTQCILTTSEGDDDPLITDFEYWGKLWDSHWWVAEFAPPLAQESYAVAVSIGDDAILQDDGLRITEQALWTPTWRDVGIEQLKRRAIMAKVKPGWFDAGALWQEANSHAAMILGLCDLITYASDKLTSDDLAEIEQQIRNGCDYLIKLQEVAEQRGHPAGAILHDLLDHQHFLCIADASKAAAAWARAARVLSLAHDEVRDSYIQCAVKSLNWAQHATPDYTVGFQPRSHGVSESYTPPQEHRTSDLLMLLQAAFDLAILHSPEHDTICIRLADQILSRQVQPAQAEDGISGHFRTFDSDTLTEKAWTHNVDGGVWGSDMGQTFPQYVMPFIDMLNAWPNHPDAGKWRDALHSYAYNFLLPVCKLSPFGILPRGYFTGQGWLHFAGLWHAMNAVYALAAAMACEFAELFDDTAFTEVAYANLQWIAGLNAGVTEENWRTADLSTYDVQPGKAIPVSMIHGIGKRFAGSWMNIRGSISNGFGTGAQFHLDMDPIRETDGPHAFHDEEWITHAGAWLSGIARFYHQPNRKA